MYSFYTIRQFLSVREIKKTIALTTSKTVKYLGINLNKEVRGIYTESHKTLMKETEEGTN